MTRSHSETRTVDPKSRSAAEWARSSSRAEPVMGLLDHRLAMNQLTQLAAIVNPPSADNLGEGPATNRTGLPCLLKTGAEQLSGQSLDHVRVHRNSSQPAALNAHAFAQGSDIHLAPGQEKHLPHETWHVVQQAQGRVKPTRQMKSAVPINDDAGLEHEADVMGARAAAAGRGGASQRRKMNGQSGGGVLQQKGGGPGSDTRAAARVLATVGGVADPALVRVLVPLLDRHVSAAIQNALGVAGTVANTRALFTSVARGDAIVRNFAAALPVATIRADGAAIADDALAGLLDLSLLIHNAGGNPLAVAAPARLALLAAGRAPAAISAAIVAIPALLGTAPRALALMDHLAANGTAADAARADAFAPHDAGVLAEALTALRGLSAVPAMAGLAQDKVEALLGERAHLVNDTVRANAVAMTVAAAGAPAAVLALAENRAFGYRAEFKARADARGATARAALVATRELEVTATARAGRGAALDNANAAAFGTLTGKQKTALGGTADGALAKAPPFVTSTNYNTGRAKFVAKRQEFARPAIAQVDAQEQLSLTAVRNVEGPAEEAAVRETHRAYFASVHFHPDALAALDAADEDRALATALVGALVATPAIRALLLSNLSTPRLRRLIQAPGVTLAALLAAGVTVPAITAFAASDARVALLVSLHAAGVAFGHVNDLATRLTPLAAYVNDAASRGDLVALLAADTPADIAAMLGATPDPQLTRAALVRAMRPRAQSAADLTTVLTLCAGFRWTQLAISNCLTPVPNGSALAVLVGAVHAAHLVRFDKATEFNAWMDAVGQLVTAGYVTITAVGGAWVRLAGTPVTYERNYRVDLAAPPRTQGETFCVHFHPDATAAGVGHAADSQSHFKPQRGGIVRRLYEAAPASIRARTQRRS